MASNRNISKALKDSNTLGTVMSFSIEKGTSKDEKDLDGDDKILRDYALKLEQYVPSLSKLKKYAPAEYKTAMERMREMLDVELLLNMINIINGIYSAEF